MGDSARRRKHAMRPIEARKRLMRYRQMLWIGSAAAMIHGTGVNNSEGAGSGSSTSAWPLGNSSPALSGSTTLLHTVPMGQAARRTCPQSSLVLSLRPTWRTMGDSTYSSP